MWVGLYSYECEGQTFTNRMRETRVELSGLRLRIDGAYLQDVTRYGYHTDTVRRPEYGPQAKQEPVNFCYISRRPIGRVQATNR